MKTRIFRLVLIILLAQLALPLFIGAVSAEVIESAGPVAGPRVLYCSETLEICIDPEVKGVYEGAPAGTTWVGGYEVSYPAICLEVGTECQPLELFEDGSFVWPGGNDCLIPEWGCTP